MHVKVAHDTVLLLLCIRDMQGSAIVVFVKTGLSRQSCREPTVCTWQHEEGLSVQGNEAYQYSERATGSAGINMHPRVCWI